MSRAQILDEEIDKLSSDKALQSIVDNSEDFLGSLRTLKEKISNDENYNIGATESAFNSWHDNTVKQEKKTHRSFRNYTAKTEKLFDFDLDSVCHYRKLDLNKDRTEELLDRAIVMELLRGGEFDIANQICEDAGMSLPGEVMDKFKELKHILDSIEKEYDLVPAINWASRNSSKLRRIGSDLEFHLHKVQFIKIYREHKDEPFDAYVYARKEFPRFVAKHLDTISKLLGTLAFDRMDAKVPGVEGGGLVSSREALSDRISRDYCSLMNMSSRSPLFNTLLASYVALPAFKKYNYISKVSHKLNWTSYNELPFEVGLPETLQFHSIFICPVSREETTPANPPMVLPCRHLISRESLYRMSKNGISGFKCPYCPEQCHMSDVKQAHFINI
ncbi:DEKNAAC103489 [Brettanomyces naardenensis]|uniref:GID complex catalytic subunit 2 n=1 Tax=Brettanomyces naardenensis TaxID=13370 RepID=A0A448YNA5_BRENA|nr:DEKNAAC103489 [Brettanomyces naardenensis]